MSELQQVMKELKDLTPADVLRHIDGDEAGGEAPTAL